MASRPVILAAALTLAAVSAGAGAPIAAPVLPSRVPAFRMGGGWISNLPLSAILSSGAVTPGRPPALTPPQRIALTRYLATLASMGPGTRPELFPRREDVLAYLADAYLAWSIALREGGPADAAHLLRVPFTLDGARWTLARIATTLAVLAPEEPRLPLFLAGPGPLPPLPSAPLEPYSLQWQLAEQARRAGAAPGFWTYDAATPAIRLPSLAGSLPGLPADLKARARRLLDLAPPPPALAEAIRAGCGADLARCQVSLGPPPA